MFSGSAICLFVINKIRCQLGRAVTFPRVYVSYCAHYDWMELIVFMTHKIVLGHDKRYMSRIQKRDLKTLMDDRNIKYITFYFITSQSAFSRDDNVVRLQCTKIELGILLK